MSTADQQTPSSGDLARPFAQALLIEPPNLCGEDTLYNFSFKDVVSQPVACIK